MKTPTTSPAWLSDPIEEGEAFRRLVVDAPATTLPKARARRRSGFHIGMSIAFLATAFAGFAPSYYLGGLSHPEPLSPWVHLHAVVFTGWLLLLLVQSALVAAHRTALHRRLGFAGAGLALLMVPLGIQTAAGAAHRGFVAGGLDPIELMIFPFGSVLLFAAFMGAAIWKRRHREAHRRLVLLATISIIAPAIARMPFVGVRPVIALALSLLFVVAGIIHDWKVRGRVHRLYLVGGLVIALSGPARYAIGHTATWRAFAESLVQATG